MTTASSIMPSTNDDSYTVLLQNVQQRFLTNAADGAPLFTTDSADLYTLFLEALPASERQQYNCSACRHFVHRFGGLVVTDAAGVAHSALWHPDDAPAPYQAAITALHQAVTRAKVSGVFSSSLQVWGNPSRARGNISPSRRQLRWCSSA